jgi:prolipoprotein diacylglyceryltransferase
MQLPQPVYPTALYEIFMCLTLFAVIWMLRKKFTTPGRLAGFYLLVNGTERFLIEQIRVNTKYEALPFQPTQAEIIAVLLFLSGALLFWKAPAWFARTTRPQS